MVYCALTLLIRLVATIVAVVTSWNYGFWLEAEPRVSKADATNCWRRRSSSCRKLRDRQHNAWRSWNSRAFNFQIVLFVAQSVITCTKSRILFVKFQHGSYSKEMSLKQEPSHTVRRTRRYFKIRHNSHKAQLEDRVNTPRRDITLNNKKKLNSI